MIHSNNRTSEWGIKDSGQDISRRILSILNNAQRYIVLGGYNFSLGSNLITIFPDLLAAVRRSVPVLLIIPGRLHGPHNPQSQIINHCIGNGIAVILNGNNHSKWLLTESDIYYGSSNFTQTSWRTRVEVASFHSSPSKPVPWIAATRQDFLEFVEREYQLFPGRPTINVYAHLARLIQSTYLQIISNAQKYNPEIEKVISTLNEYEEMSLSLTRLLDPIWKLQDLETYDMVSLSSTRLLRKLDSACLYAYRHLYNETQISMESPFPLDPSDDFVRRYNLRIVALHDSIYAQLEAILPLLEKRTRSIPKRVFEAYDGYAELMETARKAIFGGNGA